MSAQPMFRGCEPVDPPKLTTEEQAERDRLVAHGAAIEDAKRLEFERAQWRYEAEEATRRRALTPKQRADEDRERATQEHLEAEENRAWKAMKPAQRREILQREREAEAAALDRIFDEERADG